MILTLCLHNSSRTSSRNLTTEKTAIVEAIPVVEASEEALVEGEVSTEEVEEEVIKAMEGVEVDTKVHLKEAKP